MKLMSFIVGLLLISGNTSADNCLEIEKLDKFNGEFLLSSYNGNTAPIPAYYKEGDSSSKRIDDLSYKPKLIVTDYDRECEPLHLYVEKNSIYTRVTGVCGSPYFSDHWSVIQNTLAISVEEKGSTFKVTCKYEARAMGGEPAVNFNYITEFETDELGKLVKLKHEDVNKIHSKEIEKINLQ